MYVGVRNRVRVNDSVSDGVRDRVRVRVRIFRQYNVILRIGIRRNGAELLLLLLLYVAAAEFVRLTEALEVLLDTAARVCNSSADVLQLELE